jgi:hypothetical protein
MSAPNGSADLSAGVGGCLAELPLPAQLVALSTSGVAGDTAFRAVATATDLDWNEVVWLAARQRCVAPLYARVLATGAAVPWLEPVDRLRRLALVADFQLDYLHQRLIRMLDVLRAASIDVVLLKGGGLAYTSYVSPNDRPMADIDMLVRPEHAERAWNLALENGWVRRGDVPMDRSYTEHQHLPPLEDDSGVRMGLEIHTSLFTDQAPFEFSEAAIWEGARSIEIQGRPALVPSVVHQLLHCCLHFAWSHEMTFGAWRTLRDVERIVSTHDVDWDAFIRVAETTRGASCCYWTLRLARDLAFVEIPERVLHALEPQLTRWVLRATAAQFARRALPISGDEAVMSTSLWRLLWSIGVRPEAHGHGESRPWLDNPEPLPVPEGEREERPSVARRVIRKGLGVVRVLGQVMKA